jgi:hypothetical protein
VAVKLHRCSNLWVKIGAHPCWKVQKALDDAGVEYELALEPWRKGQRDTSRLAGQKLLPVIEFENGSFYREESKAMADKIKSGRLMDQDRPQAAASPPS